MGSQHGHMPAMKFIVSVSVAILAVHLQCVEGQATAACRLPITYNTITNAGTNVYNTLGSAAATCDTTCTASGQTCAGDTPGDATTCAQSCQAAAQQLWGKPTW